MLEIKVDLDKKCKRCKKGGACQNGYCFFCIAEMTKKGKFDHIIKPLSNGIAGVVKGAVKSTQEKPE